MKTRLIEFHQKIATGVLVHDFFRAVFTITCGVIFDAGTKAIDAVNIIILFLFFFAL